MTDKTKLLKYSVDYLSKYNSSKKNLERILKNKIIRMKIETKEKYKLYNLLPEIITYLENNKLIDDESFASSKITLFISSGKSRLYIKHYLLQKGIKLDLILKLLDKSDENNLNWEFESAKKFAEKKIFSKKNNNKEKSLSKMAKAGFSYEISKKILEEY